MTNLENEWQKYTRGLAHINVENLHTYTTENCVKIVAKNTVFDEFVLLGVKIRAFGVSHLV